MYKTFDLFGLITYYQDIRNPISTTVLVYFESTTKETKLICSKQEFKLLTNFYISSSNKIVRTVYNTVVQWDNRTLIEFLNCLE